MRSITLTKFFRFCGFGVAAVTFILGAGLFSALPMLSDQTPIYIVGVALIVLFIFAISWIVLSYRLETDTLRNDAKYTRLSEELEAFREESRIWHDEQINPE